MATDPKLFANVIERLFTLEVSAKPMFGDHGLYFEGKNFALVNDNILYIKVTEPDSDIAGRIAKGSPNPGPNRPSRSRRRSYTITTG